MHDLTYSQAIEKAEHLIALDAKDVYLRDAEGFPFDKVVSVETGSMYRGAVMACCYLIAEEAGLRLKLSVDFEKRGAEGRGEAMFDSDRLRELAMKLPSDARTKFANLLENNVLEALAARTNEYRTAMRAQADSEDCVRGLIAFARQETV